MLRKPEPTGVVTGPLMAMPVWAMESSTCCGSGVPCSSMTPAPAFTTFQSMSTPAAAMTRCMQEVISGPMPSPGMRVMVWVLTGAPFEAPPSPWRAGG